MSDGSAKPITPEGTSGTLAPPDGRNVVVLGPDGKFGIWPLEGSGMRLIPGLDSKYRVTGWTPDGTSVCVIASHRRDKTVNVSRVNVATGKMEFWKTGGNDLPAGVRMASAPRFSSDGGACAYVYFQELSEAYVVKGLK